MTSVLNVNTITNPSGRVEYRGLPAGNVCNVSHIRNSTRTSLGTISGSNQKTTYFGGTFTKKYNHTILVAEVNAFGNGVYSGNCGTALVLDYGVSGKESWDFGVAYSYDNNWQPYQVIILSGMCYFMHYENNSRPIEAGSHTMHFGARVDVDGGTNRPFNTLNPNSSDNDSRNRQFVSSIIIREIGL
jgi:hypothetical protein